MICLLLAEFAFIPLKFSALSLHGARVSNEANYTIVRFMF